ncbi:hypothetical protein XA68_14960 [Ophiocordyceps unilateralis]|uniref:Uncharacterized protein n=1 Tax=Ophiocordyceps unilateralis TaxID=268505 RepID=A0A2A9PPP5_OPHUN|nr:hypothetical protein XA68_14960 [Ophiocordyceps unilateralis]
MGLGRFLLPAMALGPFVASHPAGELSQLDRSLPEADAISLPEIVLMDDETGDHLQTIDISVTHTLEPTTDATPQPQGQGSKGAAGSLPDKPHDVQPAASSMGNGTKPAPTKQFNIAYAPYRADHGCKSQDEIDNDVQHLSKYYSTLRIYGTDCDQVAKVVKAARASEMNVFAGIWDPKDIENEIKLIQEGVDGNWGIIQFVSVGNELVNSGQATASDMAGAVAEARSRLREAGYQGPVVTVDTFGAYQRNKELGEASDHCTINAHAYFDKEISSPDAGQWLKNTVNDVRNSCPQSKKVIVTETGWPSQGDSNGLAAPGMDEQAAAISSIRQHFAQDPSQVFFFSAFNDLWKSPGNLNTEQYWGINNHTA